MNLTHEVINSFIHSVSIKIFSNQPVLWKSHVKTPKQSILPYYSQVLFVCLSKDYFYIIKRVVIETTGVCDVMSVT